jgi:hypothetical protein
MIKDNKDKIYSTSHYSFFEKIILNKRKEILLKLKEFLNDKMINDVLDVGSTEDEDNKSSNYIIKNLGNYINYRSISNQTINSNFFNKVLKKSITGDFVENEIKNFQSDLVISNATIEHVGSFENQKKMCINIMNLSKKYFIIITPNRFHPIEFHSKLPFIHWLPKKIHRTLLNLIGLKFLSKEENLNLLSISNLNLLMKEINFKNYEIKKISFLFFTSNYIIIGKKI